MGCEMGCGWDVGCDVRWVVAGMWLGWHLARSVWLHWTRLDVV